MTPVPSATDGGGPLSTGPGRDHRRRRRRRAAAVARGGVDELAAVVVDDDDAQPLDRRRPPRPAPDRRSCTSLVLQGDDVLDAGHRPLRAWLSLTSVPSSFTRRLVRTGAALRSITGTVGSGTFGSGLGTGSPSALATRSRLSAAIGVTRCACDRPGLPRRQRQQRRLDEGVPRTHDEPRHREDEEQVDDPEMTLEEHFHGQRKQQARCHVFLSDFSGWRHFLDAAVTICHAPPGRRCPHWHWVRDLRPTRSGGW